jgi:small ligand-binding sensory domain FIST
VATKVGVGLSQHRNTRAAAREATERALAAADTTRPDFVIVFMTVGHDPAELLPEIRAATGHAPLTGCSVSGCIAHGVADESAYCVEVTVIASDELRFHNARVADITADPQAAGRVLGEALRPHFGEDAAALLFFGDAFTLNYTSIKAGLDEALGLGRFIPVLGGGANNDIQSLRTFQFHDDEIHEHGAVCTLLSGRGTVLSTVTHGCYPLGVRQTVTRSRGNMIYEIDGKRALDVIESYITEQESQNWLHAVNNLCLGLDVPAPLVGEYDKLCIRYMVGRDPEAGAVMIQTEVAEGTSIWLARRDTDRIGAEADRAAVSLRERIGDRTPKMMLHFECTGRGKLMLRESFRQELIRRTQVSTPDGVPWLGAYVGGEIAPVGETNMFHNYTAVVVAVL